MAAVNEEDWYEPPTKEDGSYDLVQVARDLSTFVSEVGGYILDGASICADLEQQLPPRGPLTDLFLELLEGLKFIEAKWAYANDALLTTATLVGIEARHRRERAA